MPIAFNQVGVISGVDGSNILNNPTSLQFGPDGRLYVTEQNGSVNAFTVELQNGEYVATASEQLEDANGNELVKSIQNHDDFGEEIIMVNRQVTGILIGGTAESPILYISSSNPNIASNGEQNIVDTNSGVLTRATLNPVTGEWDVVDLIRGLPRSEENHSVNGMVFGEDGTTILLQVGGFTNNGGPSSFFSYTNEYALAGTILEIDLADIESRPILTDPQGGQGDTPRDYVYDLPTLDDPNIENVTDGVGEDEFGMDEDGPWGGNDGLNQAILPADAPMRIYADGLRNAYDLTRTPDGKLYSVDNGSNGGLGGAPNTETNDDDGDGIANEAITSPGGGSFGEGEPLIQIVEGGYYYHANPLRSNQNQSWTVYGNDGNPDPNVTTNFVQDISSLVPDAVNIADGFLIDPSKFAGLEGLDPNDPADRAIIDERLFLSGLTIDSDALEQNDPDGAGPGQQVIEILGSSTNGIMTYDSGGAAFNGAIDGKLFVTQFNDNITLLNINDAGTALEPVFEEGPDGIFGTADDVLQDADGVVFIANNSLGVNLANPLDVVQGPNGTLWVAEIGGNEITVLAPSVVIDPTSDDSDGDGLLNAVDPFLRDASNGTSVIVGPQAPTVWEFSQGAGDTTPGPDGFGGGVTGVMIDGSTDFEQFFQSPRDPSDPSNSQIQLDNVKFVTAAGGGTTTIEEVSDGDPAGTSNNGQFLFHTGFKLAANVETFTVSWVVANPGAVVGGSDITNSFQQIGGYLGDGTQSNFVKIVAIATNNDASTANIQIVLEDGDAVQQTINLPANDIFDNALLVQNSAITFELEIDPTAGTAVPKATFVTTAGNVEVTGTEVLDLTGSAVLNTILGQNTINGQDIGIAAGLFSSNVQGGTDTFQAVFDSITVTATEAEIAPDAVDDSIGTGVDAVLAIPVAQLLANDVDPNAGDTLTVVGVSNPQNGTVSLDGGIVTFTPDTGFEGSASFDYTISDGTPTPDDTATVTVSVANSTVLYRVNAGGVKIVVGEDDAVNPSDPDLDWADNTGVGAQSGTGFGGLVFSNNTGNISTQNISTVATTGTYAVPADVPTGIYTNERWDPAADAEMQWSFEAPVAGDYTVRLFMGNGFAGTSAVGQRVFDINIEGGVLEYDDVDLVALLGGTQIGGMFEQTVNVTDGELNIEFLRQVENPLINGIEIVGPIPVITPPTPTIDIVSGDATVNEADGTIQVSVLASETVPAGPGLNFTYVIEGVTALEGTDYEPDASLNGTGAGSSFTGSATIAGGSSDFQIPIEILQDLDMEPSETFTVTITSVGPGYAIGAGTATITIQDDDTVTVPGQVLFRINAGGAEVAATDGGMAWSEDQSAVNANNVAVLGTPSQYLVDRGTVGDDVTYGVGAIVGANNTGAPDALFTTERYSALANPDNLGYAFNVDNGDYTVNLYFDELFFTAAGQRVFDVEIEGDLVLDDFDTYVAAGNTSNTVLESFDVTVSDGQLNLEFLKTAANNPNVAAIEIIAAIDPAAPAVISIGAPAPASVIEGGDTGVTTLEFAVSFDKTPDEAVTVAYLIDINGTETTGSLALDTTDGVISVDVPNDDVENGTETVTVTLTGVTVGGTAAVLGTAISAIGTVTEDDQATPTGGEVLFRVNAGGPTIIVGADDATDASEPDWIADTNANPNPNRILDGGGPNEFTSTAAITVDPAEVDGAPAALFDTERWDPIAGEELKYAFDVPNGQYVVKLYMVEGSPDQSVLGARSFDVSVEGTVPTAFDNITPFDTYGNAGFVLTATVDVIDGELNLEFLHDVIENPKINGIEIIAAENVVSEISIGDAGIVAENGDLEDTTLTFPVTFDTPPSGDVTVEYDLVINGGTPTALTAVIAAVGGSIVVNIPSDVLANGDESVSVTLTGIAAGNAVLGAQSVGTGTVSEDDVPYTPPLDNLFGTAVEIADDGTSPSDAGTLSIGDNVMSATQEGEGDGDNMVRDRDYFTFTVPEGAVLTGIFLDSFVNDNPTAPDGFMAIALGNQITADPTNGDTTGLLSGIVYGSGNTGGNLLSTMSAGVSIIGTPVTFDPFEAALTGEITVWLNQGAGPGTPTLNFVVEQQGVIAIADAPTIVEGGDDVAAFDTLEFPLTGPADATVTIDYTVGGVAQTPVEVTFDGAGSATLLVQVAQDDIVNADDVAVALTGVSSALYAIGAAASATGTVTEDDASVPGSIVGTDGEDTLDGGPGSDWLTGGGDADRFVFRSGDVWSEVQDFEVGVDRILVEGFTAEEISIEAWRDPGDTLIRGADGSRMVLRDVDASQITVNDFEGITFGGPLVGTPDNDTLIGTIGDDTISGLAGNDRLFGGDGEDTLDGGLGSDWLSGGGGADRFVLRAGDVWSEVNDFEDGVDRILVEGFTAGEISIEAWRDPGDTLIRGADGTRMVLRDVDASQITLADFDGITFGGPLVGTPDNDTLIGTIGDDTISGLAGNDRLFGGDGEDTLEGGSGSDWLIGGGGADRFVFRAGDVWSEVQDFEDGVDRILVEGFTAGEISIEAWRDPGDTLIRGADGTRMVLRDVDASQITVDDLIFGATLNQGPTVSNEIADQMPLEDAPYSFVVPADTFADDADVAELTLNAMLDDNTDLPGWLTFDPLTGTFSGTPLQVDVDAGPITVKVTATDVEGEAISDEFVLTPQNVNDVPLGIVTITGVASQGETLTASNNLTDADGLGTITYQWQADGADIAGATGDTFTLTQAEVGAEITVVASYTDNGGTVESVPSAATAVVTNTNDAPVGTVTISGVASQGAILTASNDLTDADGLGTITYQWQADGADIAGAIGATFTLTQAEVGAEITVVASYTDDGGTLETVPSAATAVVQAATDGQALFTANIAGGDLISASTFAENSMQIANQSTNDVSITKVIIDLADTLIPDTAFDTQTALEGGPIGDATSKPFDQGSQTTGFTPVSGSGQLGPFDFTITMGDEVIDPQTGGEGNNQLILDFAPGEFAVGDLLSFSIDIDPFTATVGPIGGAVAGFEIAGGTVTVEFDDGSSATSVIAPVNGTVSGRALMKAGQENLGVPTLTLGDGTTAARVVNDADLPITIDAGVENANGTARIFILDTAFVSNGDSISIDPPASAPNGVNGGIQGNNAQGLANVVEVLLDANGVFNGTVPMTRATTQEVSANGNLGFNYFSVGVVDGNGEVTQISDALVVEYDPLADVPPVVDSDGPTAVITLTNPVAVDAPLLVSIAYDDASGIDATTLDDADLELSIFGAVIDSAASTFIDFADGVATYSIDAPVDDWVEGLTVTVALKAGEVEDNATPSNANLAVSEVLTLDIGGGSTGGDEILLRINAYGPQVNATDGGPNWLTDGDGTDIGTPSTFLAATQLRGDAPLAGYTGTAAAVTAAGIPESLLDTARSSDAPFSYNIPVSALNGNGNYTVTLYVAELFGLNQVAGARSFDVAIEGLTQGVLNNVDPAALGLVSGSGGDVTAISYNIAVTDGVLNIGFLQDLADNPIINAIEIASFSGEIEPPVEPPADPTDAIAILEAAEGVDTDGSYTAGETGSAVLTIMDGVNNVQSSNFGDNSFELTNTGDKQIAAVFLDFRDALYRDSIIDFDGSSGDTTARLFAIQNGAGTTGDLPLTIASTYFLPGDDPLENTTGTGVASAGGFRGLLLRFDGTEGGFSGGEAVGFSGDMDPNSIAGLFKSGTNGVDTGALNSWDVGGVSGAELIGSSFTVMFDDGTFATGYLGSDGSEAGSIGQAVENQAMQAATVTVNGFGSTQVGSYGGTEPEIVVTGPANATVLVTMSKGLNPVTNNNSGVADLVSARLGDAHPEFQVNNNADIQTVEITLDGSGTATLPAGSFDYNTPDGGGQDFASSSYTAGYATAPIVIAASVIDAADHPLGPVDRVYLSSNGTPVDGVPPVDPVEGYFAINGSGGNVFFKIQIEDQNGVGGGTNPGGKWNFETAADSEGRQAGFEGDGYYLFGSDTSTAIDNQVGGNELLEYTIFVPEEELGIYNFSFTVSRDGVAAGDQQNDLWLNFKPAEDVGNGDIEAFLTNATATQEPEPTVGGFIKVFGGPNDGSWGAAQSYDGLPANPAAQIEITEAGLYTIQIDGRSQGFHVDYFELYKGSNPGGGAENSTFVPTGPAAPVITGAENSATVLDGTTFAFDVDATDFNLEDVLTYSITGGADGGLFAIDSNTGEVSFQAAPNFALPGDVGGDNVYNVQVTVTDNSADTLTDVRDYVVTVTDQVPTVTLEIPIDAIADDWEQLGGAVSQDLEFGLNGTTLQYVGLRFDGIDIPDGATISNAYIAFQALEGQTGAASFTIAMENTESAAAYATGNAPDAAGRFYTDEFIWNPEAWTAGDTYETPDLTSLIVEVIGTDGVTDGEFAFLIDGIEGSRVAYPFDNAGGDAPTLFIDYDIV